MIAPSAKRGRASLLEYGATGPSVRAIAESVALDVSEVRSRIVVAGERLVRMLGLASNPFTLTGDTLRAADVAGLLRVHPRLELEIAPKFLGSEWSSWREDFFFLAMLSMHGRLLANDRVGAAAGDRADLAVLLARAIITMYWESHRRPLRTYRRAQVIDFVVDGDVEPEALVLPAPEGYWQQVIAYDRLNPFNATILAAAETLLREIREPQTRQQLARVVELLAPQRRATSAAPRRVPSRAARWQPLYELAQEILKGFGATFDRGALRAPGFILHTWRVWEDLLNVSLRMAYGGKLVGVQRSFALGSRSSIDASGGAASTKTVWVTPDFTVAGSALELLVDAKYKGRAGDARNRIAESDLYEALAFAAAAKQKQVVLVYPAVPKNAAKPKVGTTSVFERVNVGSVTITGLEVEVRDISRAGSLRAFADGLKAALEIAHQETNAT